MSENPELPIAVDTAGGDRGITVQVEGAVQAWKDFGCKTTLVGPENELKAILAGLGNNFPIGIEHAPEVITMHDSPIKAIRKKPNSSLCVAYNLVEQNRASSILSAGNSGAMMAAGRIICGLLPRIERPAIATLIPVAGDALPNVILDSGANVECHAHHLVQFAVMGAVYFETLFEGQVLPGTAEPVSAKIALLSNGEEATKGTDVIRAAYTMLSQMPTLNFVGFVEGRDVPANKANVIVCDGMIGNVLLKGMEGCVRLFFDQLMHEGKKSLFGRLALALSTRTYRRVFREKFDYSNYGGAPLLGLRKLAVVLHGSSDARAVKNAIRVADTFSRLKMVERITSELNHLDEMQLFTDEEFFIGNFGKGKFYENGIRSKGSVTTDKLENEPEPEDGPQKERG